MFANAFIKFNTSRQHCSKYSIQYTYVLIAINRVTFNLTLNEREKERYKRRKKITTTKPTTIYNYGKLQLEQFSLNLSLSFIRRRQVKLSCCQSWINCWLDVYMCVCVCYAIFYCRCRLCHSLLNAFHDQIVHSPMQRRHTKNKHTDGHTHTHTWINKHTCTHPFRLQSTVIKSTN